MIKNTPSILRSTLGLTFALPLLVPRAWAADSTPPEPGTIHLDAKTSAKALKVLRAEIRAKGDADDQFWPSIHACEALTLAGHGDEVTKELTPKLKTEKNAQHLVGLARELVRAGDRTKVAIMLDILADKDPQGHVHACESLYKVNEIGDGILVRTALKSENIKQALMAAAALGRQGNQQGLDLLRKELTNEDPEIARICAWVLGRIGDPRGDIPSLRAGLSKQSDPLVRAYFENSLALLGDPRGITAVLRNLRSEDPAVRTYSATFAGEARVTAAKDRLIPLLDDENIDVRVRAAQALIVLSQPVPPNPREDISREVFPATKENPRYSEGSILAMPDGKLLYATTEFIGSGSDHAEARIIARQSPDGGRNWGDTLVLQAPEKGKNIMSVTLRYLTAPLREDTTIGLFYVRKNSLSDMHPFLRTSSAKSPLQFGEESILTDEAGYQGINNDRITRLSDGRLLAPMWFSPDIKKISHIKSYCLFSDDVGKTWKKSKDIIDYSKRGAMEPETIEFTDGTIGMLIRTQSGHIAIARSQDRGETWSKAESWNIRAPEAPATIRRIPSTGDLLIIWNDNYEEGAGHSGKRSPLTAAISSDEGKTWRHKMNLESSTAHTFSYVSLAFHHGRAIMGYYVRDEKTTQISSRFRSLPISWFYQ
jgi:sialidase-1